ncbi:MAG: hypothetical protein DMF68_06130 [Acidobacteria bacterium]|nr:MAG: hypothetical protein DMF68_06130 [Acidobacteriota bacterium]
MLQRLAIGTLSLLLLIPTLVGSSADFIKGHKSKEDKTVPEGQAILWREPKDIGRRNLYLGPGGEAMKPDLSHLTLIKKEKGGYSTKYRVRDAQGREWVVKVGKEAQSETAASRLLWGVGYNSDVNYLVPSVHVDGINKPLTNVRFSARPKDIKRVDGFNWSDNPFVGSRELQGLKVMMALLNNWDIKDSNNKILVVQGKNGKKELQYEVHDLGASFGKLSHLPRWLQFKPDRNDPKAYARSHLVDKVKDGDVRLHYSVKRSDLFKGISVEDARWVGSMIGRLSRQQLADAFRSANYSPDEVRLMTEAVAKRVTELKSLPANPQLAKRRVR